MSRRGEALWTRRRGASESASPYQYGRYARPNRRSRARPVRRPPDRPHAGPCSKGPGPDVQWSRCATTRSQ